MGSGAPAMKDWQAVTPSQARKKLLRASSISVKVFGRKVHLLGRRMTDPYLT